MTLTTDDCRVSTRKKTYYNSRFVLSDTYSPIRGGGDVRDCWLAIIDWLSSYISSPRNEVLPWLRRHVKVLGETPVHFDQSLNLIIKRIIKVRDGGVRKKKGGEDSCLEVISCTHLKRVREKHPWMSSLFIIVVTQEMTVKYPPLFHCPHKRLNHLWE